MKTKRLGNSDLSITPVGFGAWAIGGSGWEFGWGEQDDKASVAAIHRALDLALTGSTRPPPWNGPPESRRICAKDWHDLGHTFSPNAVCRDEA
jgi:hypothetical protein